MERSGQVTLVACPRLKLYEENMKERVNKIAQEIAQYGLEEYTEGVRVGKEFERKEIQPQSEPAKLGEMWLMRSYTVNGYYICNPSTYEPIGVPYYISDKELANLRAAGYKIHIKGEE